MKKTRNILAIALVLITIALTAITGFAAYENTYKNTGNQRDDIIGVARTQLGYTEGYNNDTKYGTWYGLPNQPWCAMFVSWCARQANIPTSVLKNSACAGTGSQYFNIPYYDGSSYTPKKGDLFFTKGWTHVGLVSSVDGAYFYSIEGNSNSNGSSEGVAVVSNKRKTSNFYFGVPSYNDHPCGYTIDTRYPTPFIARTISTGKVTCYSDVNGSSVGKIYPEDDVIVQEVYTNGWVKGSCPWSGGSYKTIYVPKSVFINSSNTPQKYTATQKTDTYLRSSDSSAWGWIDPGDTCYSIYKNGSRTMVLYPTSNGRLRLAWTTAAVQSYTLDLNSSVNGTKVWDLNGIGTADVYIGGKLVANDCSDYCQTLAKGTTYKITDIRAKSGYTYTGAKTVSGTLNGNRDIVLPFKKVETCSLDLNCSVDGAKRWDLKGIATADVYNKGRLIADNCEDYCGYLEKGTSYKITDIRAKSGYTYTGAKTISGTLNGNRDITLTFKKVVPVQPGWEVNFRMKSGAYTNAYDGVNGTKVGRVYPNDVVTVKYVYTNGWMKLSCPWDGGYNRIVYVKIAECKFSATKYINAYSAVNGTKVGRVYPNDLVTVKALYSSGWMKCVCPWDNGSSKTIYIRYAEIY